VSEPAGNEKKTPCRLRLRQRLRDTKDFQRVYDAQEAIHGPSLVVFYRHNGLDFSRMGVSVGRKHGGAVRRNRLKRVLREAWRLMQAELPKGLDYVLVPRRGVKVFRTPELCAALEQMARKLPIPGEGTRAAVARKGEYRLGDEEPPSQGAPAKRRTGISSRTFLKKPPQKP